IFVGELVQGRMDGERSAEDRIRLGEAAKFEPETDLRLRILVTAGPLDDGGEPLRGGPRGIRGQPHLFEIGRRQGMSHGQECKRRFLSLRRWRTFKSEEHTSELQSRFDLVCRLLLEKKKTKKHRD